MNDAFTEEQVRAAVAGTRLSDKMISAAALVLVERLSYAEAARRQGIKHRQNVYRATQIARAALLAGGKCPLCGAPTREETGGG